MAFWGRGYPWALHKGLAEGEMKSKMKTEHPSCLFCPNSMRKNTLRSFCILLPSLKGDTEHLCIVCRDKIDARESKIRRDFPILRGI
jgi:hypothetical protein